MPEKHVELLAMLSHARMQHFCGLRRRDHVWTESRSMTNVLVRSGLAVWRKVGSASDLRVESCPRHTQRVEASPAIPTAVISILHWRMSLEAPKMVCTLDRCCEHQPTHLLHARYRMCICDRYGDIYVYVCIWWTGSTMRQSDDHRAVGGKSKMPHETPQRDSESRPSGSRFRWNPEIYLSLNFDPGNRTLRAWRLPKVLADWAKPASHVMQVSAQSASTSGNRQARRVRFPGSKSKDKYFSGFHHISHVCAVCFF